MVQALKLTVAFAKYPVSPAYRPGSAERSNVSIHGQRETPQLRRRWPTVPPARDESDSNHHRAGSSDALPRNDRSKMSPTLDGEFLEADLHQGLE